MSTVIVDAGPLLRTKILHMRRSRHSGKRGHCAEGPLRWGRHSGGWRENRETFGLPKQRPQRDHERPFFHSATPLSLYATPLYPRQPCWIAPVSACLIDPGFEPPARGSNGTGASVAAQSHNAEAVSRGARMLRTALGPQIAGWLDDESVVDVMLNPDGRLWLDRLKSGLEDAGANPSPEDGERIVRLVAHHVGAEVHVGAPRVSAKLPETGERFEGLLPPPVAVPSPSASPRSLCSRSTIMSRAASSRRSISRAYLSLTGHTTEVQVSRKRPQSRL